MIQTANHQTAKLKIMSQYFINNIITVCTVNYCQHWQHSGQCCSLCPL